MITAVGAQHIQRDEKDIKADDAECKDTAAPRSALVKAPAGRVVPVVVPVDATVWGRPRLPWQKGVWQDDAAVDDRRTYIVGVIESHLGLERFSAMRFLIGLCMDYVGCMPCDDREYKSYRDARLMIGVALPPQTCALAHKQAFDLVSYDPQDRLVTIAEGKGNGIEAQRPRLYCRYCGLTRFHHVGNREHVSRWSLMESDNCYRYHPQNLYCSVRCPVHQCRSCHRPFVKVSEVHLCATCLVEFRSKPLFERFWRPMDGNCYVDEINSHVTDLPTTVIRERHTSYHSKSGGTTSYTVTRTVVDSVKANEVVKAFLDQTERTCAICRERFRLPIVPPISLSAVTGSAVVSAVVPAPFSAVNRPLCAVDREVICGFCPIPST